MSVFSIPCELTITPGTPGATQNKLRLSVNGEIVFEDYEMELAPEQRAVCKQIADAHSRLLKKWSTA